jgi:predicted RNase H-like nuclease (RuvC/YqgF family)
MSLERLKELLATVESDELKQSVLKVYSDDVDSEKQTGITKYNKKDSELLKLKQAVRDTGFDSEKHSTLKDYVESLKGVVDDKNNSDLKVNALETKLTDLTTQLETERTTAKTNSIKAKLSQAIGSKFKGSELLINSLISDGKVDIQDGNYYFKDGDSTKTFEDGVAGLEETYKDLLIVEQHSGGGDNGGSSNKLKSFNEMSADDALSQLGL